MGKNLYKVRDKQGDRSNVSADFHSTNNETGVITFYNRYNESANDFVARFESPISIKLASSNSKKTERKPCSIVAKLLDQHNKKLKLELKSGIEGFKANHDDYGVDYVTYSFGYDLSVGEQGIDDAIENLYKNLSALICSIITLKSAEKPEGCKVSSRNVEIHYRQWPEYEIEGDRLYLTTRLTAHHKQEAE